MRYLLGLHPDPYMFHQANMRQDVSSPLCTSPSASPFFPEDGSRTWLTRPRTRRIIPSAM